MVLIMTSIIGDIVMLSLLDMIAVTGSEKAKLE